MKSFALCWVYSTKRSRTLFSRLTAKHKIKIEVLPDVCHFQHSMYDITQMILTNIRIQLIYVKVGKLDLIKGNMLY
jgi:hypothetical protein